MGRATCRLSSLQYRRYDEIDRLVDVAEYGTNGSGNASDLDIRPSGWLPFPTRSNEILVTRYTYYDDGSLKDIVDPMNRTRRTEYDAAGRVTREIANCTGDGSPGGGTNNDEDQTIRYEYADGLRTKYIADLPSGQTDQETTYTYGTVKTGTAPSDIATGHLRTVTRIRLRRFDRPTNASTLNTRGRGGMKSELIWDGDSCTCSEPSLCMAETEI